MWLVNVKNIIDLQWSLYSDSSRVFGNLAFTFHKACKLKFNAFTEQFTEMEENLETFMKDPVTQITDVEQTIVEGDDIKDDRIIPTIPTAVHGT